MFSSKLSTNCSLILGKIIFTGADRACYFLVQMTLSSIEDWNLHFSNLSILLHPSTSKGTTHSKYPLKQRSEEDEDLPLKRSQTDSFDQDNSDNEEEEKIESDDEFHSFGSESDLLTNSENISNPLSLKDKFQQKLLEFKNQRSNPKKKQKTTSKDKGSKKNQQKLFNASNNKNITDRVEQEICQDQSYQDNPIDNVVELNDKSQRISKKNRTIPAHILQKLKSRQEEISQLPEEQQIEAKEKDAWKKAELTSKGIRVHDDSTRLEKTIKKQQKSKQKRREQWAKREETCENAKKEKQQQRADNILKRKNDRKHKKKSK